ncbi:histidine kinase [Streptomyces sp. M19]
MTSGFDSTSAKTVALILLLAYSLIAGRAASAALSWSLGRRARPTALMAVAMVAAVGALALVISTEDHDIAEPRATFIYALGSAVFSVAALTVKKIPARRIVGLVLLVAAVTGAMSLAAGLAARMALANAILGLFFAVAAVSVSRLSAWPMHILWELVEARDTRARLAVAEERLRIARDLHDVMGRNLSVLALKGELAAQLARRGATDTAVEQMEEVQRIAREGQSEVRAVVRGYREADLATELSGARGMLESAGIECDIETSGPDGAAAASLAPPYRRHWAGWSAGDHQRAAPLLRRELRDPAARGGGPGRAHRREQRGPRPGQSSGGNGGSGLAGLRERLAAIGGTLTTRAQDGTFVLTASVPRLEK